MTPSMLMALDIALLVILVVFSGFFSASETALTAASRARIHALVNNGNKRAVKVANLRRLQQTQPQISTVVTYNADVNAPMVAINDALGFRPVAYMGELQKKLS